MGNFMADVDPKAGLDRVDGRLKVTGAAKFSAEYTPDKLTYGIVVASTITRGKIEALDTKKAEAAPGVIKVVSHLNAPEVPGYKTGSDTAKEPTGEQPLRVFHDSKIYFNGQPIALVIADTLERAVYAASLVKARYSKEAFNTNLEKNMAQAAAPKQDKPTYLRGEAFAYKNAAVSVEAQYVLAREVHNPMELHSIIAIWDGDEKVTVYEKTQGVKSTQQSIMDVFKLEEKNVQVISKFVGGGFGSALRTWPHSIAAVIGARVVKRPLKLMLSRDQMFTMVGYRPYTWQKIGIGATKDGKLTGITHEAIGETSRYEAFTEGVVNMSKFMYACPNVNTSYKILPVDLSTPTWMRGPGEATGSWALESAMDELAYKLKLDPLELRLRNYAETDPERNLPFSSKFLRECYEVGADKIGWNKRNPVVGSMNDGAWKIGYGVSTGTFGAYRDKATVTAKLSDQGILTIECAVSDSGPGTATSMTELASKTMGLPPAKVVFELGDSKMPEGPTQGGSATTSSLGSAVYEACGALKLKLMTLASKDGSAFSGLQPEGVGFSNGEMSLLSDSSKKISITDILKQNNLPQLEITITSEPGKSSQGFSMYSFSVHFVEVRVHPLTGVVRVHRAVAVSDAGKIVSPKAAHSQAIGGVVGGIGMALTEEAVIDDRYGRYVNNNFADYHVPVNADVPKIEAIFINKPDPYTNPMGSKGLGEIALIGFAAAVANAVYHATGKRIRALPITPDKVLG